MQKQALSYALDKAGISSDQLDYVFAGDLLNQCIATSYSLRAQNAPFFGLYGACSTMAEGMSLAAMLVDGGFASYAAALTSSHFCSAERQYRNPLEYGGQKPPTAQRTTTGSGAVILSRKGTGPFITHVTTGKVVDKGITDANNMGAAMAPAAYATLHAHFEETGRSPDFYDLIVTGDLGSLGKEIVTDFFQRDGIDLRGRYDDCGVLLFDPTTQDVHAGGSGCGCSAVVLTGHLLREMRRGTYRNLLFCGQAPSTLPPRPCRGEHPWNLSCRGHHHGERRCVMSDASTYFAAFLCGGILCLIGQILIDKTKLTPARILVLYVVVGVILGATGLYGHLVELCGAGATVPLTGFGYNLARGVSKAVAESGFLGTLLGGVTAAAGGITAAVFFGYLAVSSLSRSQKPDPRCLFSLRLV